MKTSSFAASAAALAALMVLATAPCSVAAHKKKGCRKKMKGKDCGAPSSKRPTKKPAAVTIPAKPTEAPTRRPTRLPTLSPTDAPTRQPTEAPTGRPTMELPLTCPGVEGTVLSFNGHAYGIVPELRTWVEADAHAATLRCCSRAGHLVTVTSLAEKAAMEAVVRPKPRVGIWIGIHAEAGKWVWTAGEGDADTATIMTDFSYVNPFVFAGTAFSYADGTGAVGYGHGRMNATDTKLASVVEFDCYDYD